MASAGLLEEGRAEFRLDSGREVSLRQVVVELATLNVLEGRFEVIRRNVISRVPERVAEHFGTRPWLLTRIPPDEVLPTWLVLSDLISYAPIREGDFSRLVVCWFSDELPKDLPGHLAGNICSVDWDSAAADGEF
jgi:hypothetical protein